MRKILFLLTAVAALGLVAFAAEIPKDKQVLNFKTMMGTVTFSHQAHVDRAPDGCVTCHHKTKAGETPKPCSACHDKKKPEGKKLKLKDAVHKTCWGCHKENLDAGKKGGPIKKDCKVCHVRKKK